MAIKLERSGDRHVYSCLSTDTKPTTGIVVDAICLETDTGDRFEFDGDSWQESGVGGVNKVTDQTIHAGARRPTSTQESYESIKEDWNYSIIDLAVAASQTVYDGPAIFGNAIVTTAMSAHAVTLDDDAAPVITLAASSAIDYDRSAFKGMRFETSLKITSDAVATGVVLVMWRKL